MTKSAAAATFLLISAASWATTTGTTSAPPSDRPTGRLVLGLHPPEQVAVMDVASGRLVRRRLPGGTLCHGPLMAAGDRAVWISPRGALEARTLDLRGPARVLGRAAMVLRGGEDRFWLMRLRYRRTIRAVDVRAVTARGVVLMRSRHPAPAGYPSGATARSLVIERGGRTWQWDPGTGRRRRAPAAVLVAARGSLSAWCSLTCRRVYLEGGRRPVTSNAISGMTLAPSGSISPDERRLALPAYRGSMRTARIALVDMATGAASLVPGAALSANGALDWSDTGEWLYFAAPERRVRAYRVADDRMITLPGRMPAPVLELSAAGRGPTRSTSRRAPGSPPPPRPGRAGALSART
jgi:hypothetical protein